MVQRTSHPDVVQLTTHLTQLLQKGRAGAFLNVACDSDYWVQFVKNKHNYVRSGGPDMPPHLLWRAVANDVLPLSRQLSDVDVTRVQQFGFVYPCSPHPIYDFYATGFVKVLPLTSALSVPTMVDVTMTLFAHVYRCPPEERLRFELALQGLR